MGSFGGINGQQGEDEIGLQRALEESLMEYNGSNRTEASVPSSLEEGERQTNDEGFQSLDGSVTFEDLISYSRSVRNELVNALSSRSADKKQRDVDSLSRIIRGEIEDACDGVAGMCGGGNDGTYDCPEDPELRPLPLDAINDMIEVIFGAYRSVLAQDNDIKRWINHTVEFGADDYPAPEVVSREADRDGHRSGGTNSSRESRPTSANMSYCLIQQGGGPCGVLASLNGFIISQLVFDPLRLERERDRRLRGDLFEYLDSVPERDCWEALIRSICMVIFQSSPESRYRIVQFRPRTVGLLQDHHKIGDFDLNRNLLISPERNLYYYVDYGDILDVYRFYSRRLKGGIFSKTGSLFSILLSVVGSRTPDRIRSDMDDFTTTPLIGMFGHCSQELVNLFITGNAVSNVFDGVKVLDDGDSGKGAESFSLKGIDKRSVLGYLTEHEALRYCKVGLNYKYPLYPIWIIMDKNHYQCSFTLNFTECVLTVYEEFTQVMQRAFEKFDVDGSGFILESQLGEFLGEICLGECVSEVQKLSENGIVLWDDLQRSVLGLVGIEGETDGSSAGGRHKLWTSVYAFDHQKHVGKKLTISTIFPQENYSRAKGLFYHELSSRRGQMAEMMDRSGRSPTGSTEEQLDLASIMRTRWGEGTVIEIKQLFGLCCQNVKLKVP